MRPAGDMLEFRLLGPLEVLRGGRRIDLGGAMEQTLLVALLLARNRFVSADELSDALWPNEAPASANLTLRSYVSRLRRRLEPSAPPGSRTSVIESRSRAYRLVAQDEAFDSVRFEAALKVARQGLEALDPGLAARTLRRALTMWRGRPLADLAYRSVASGEADRLEELRMGAVELLAEAEIALGHAEDAVARLEELVGEDPTRERGWLLLVEALALAGRWSQALRRAAYAREVLRSELGVEPGPELQAMIDAVRERRVVTRFPHRPRLPPRPLTPLVGRQSEFRELLAMMSGAGLTTVVGPAGVGKTRLALEVANRLSVERGPASLLWIDVAPLTDEGYLSGAVADALGAAEPAPGAEWAALAAALGTEPPALVFDNCDHLVSGCASLVRAMLEHRPAPTILVTSREALGLPGERILPLAPLPVPGDEVTDVRRIAASPAVQLLVQRASDARHGFVVTGENARDVAAIVRRLDGLPLAIELAAGRLRSLTPAELLSRLADTFGMLGVASEGRMARHRTLHAAIAWGYDLMSEPEQVVFRRLSPFHGSFGLDEAEVVCAGGAIASSDVAGLLARLVDRSMLLSVSGPGARTTRFRLLETLRDFAADVAARDDDPDALRRRHCYAYRLLVERTEPMLRGPRLADGLARLDGDRPNITAALRWADSGLELSGLLWRYWLKRGLVAEGLEWLNLALAHAADAHVGSVARAETAATMLALALDLPEAEAHADRAVAWARRSGDAHLMAWARLVRGLYRARSGMPERARIDAESALAMLGGSEDIEGTATGLAALGMADKYAGRPDEAAAHFARARHLYEQLGDDWDAGWAIINQADVALRTRDDHAARALVAEAVKRFRSVADRRALATCKLVLAGAEVLAGERASAEARLRDVLAMARRYGYAAEARRAAETLAELSAS